MIGIQGELDLDTIAPSPVREIAIAVAIQLQATHGYGAPALALILQTARADLATIAATPRLHRPLAQLAGRTVLPQEQFREHLQNLIKAHPAPTAHIATALGLSSTQVDDLLRGGGRIRGPLATAIATLSKRSLALAADAHSAMAMDRMSALKTLALLRRVGVTDARIAVSAGVSRAHVRHPAQAGAVELARLARLTPERACDSSTQIAARSVNQHLERLAAAAGGWEPLVSVGVVLEDDLRRLLANASPTVPLSAALAVLMIDPDEVPRVDDGEVDAGLTRARLHSLSAMGYPAELIESWVDVVGLRDLADRIPTHTARLVRAFYRRHHMMEGPNLRTLRSARAALMPTPLSWDDPGGLEWAGSAEPDALAAVDSELIDPLAIEIACTLTAPAPALTSDEKRLVIDELLRRGESTSVIVSRTRTDRGAVCRRRRELMSS